MTTIALNRVRWPARVCFWTGLIYGVDRKISLIGVLVSVQHLQAQHHQIRW